jgi:type II secretory pathway pseudopilin PulG
MRHGFTLLELTGVLILMAVAGSLFLPAARNVGERLSVVGAREDLVAMIAQARGEALRRGGSSLVIIRSPAEIRIEADGETLHRVDLATSWGTEIVLSGGRPSAELRFDALGLGRMAAHSITLTRGAAIARLIVSAFGRIRRE